jgi:polar amino acid transport system substrate-binding protein
MRIHPGRLSALAAALTAGVLALSACGSSTPSGAGANASSSGASSTSAAAGATSGSAAAGATSGPATAGSAAGSGSAAPSSAAGAAIPDTAAILAAVKADPSLSADLPAAIKSAGTLKVGSNVQSPPNNFYAADGTTVVGFEKDLITAVAAQLGLKVTYSDMAFDSLITSLASGRIDATIAGMNDNKTRQQKIDFVDYFNSGITIMVQKGNPAGINSSADLCGKSIAVVTGTSQEDFAAEQTTACTKAGKPAVQVSATDSDSQNQTQLRTGRVAAIINDLPSAVYISRTAGDGKYFQVVNQPPVNGAPYGIGVSKANAALSKAMEASLQKLISGGQYGAILKAWQVQSGALTKATINGG